MNQMNNLERNPMTRTKVRPLSAALLLAYLHCLPLAYADVEVLTQVLETSSDVTPLPRSVPSNMTLRACHSCPFQIARVDESTVFFAGDRQQVTLEQLLQACGTETIGYGVVYDHKTKAVKRLLTTCPIPPAGIATRR